jgi:hypothetical protein
VRRPAPTSGTNNPVGSCVGTRADDDGHATLRGVRADRILGFHFAARRVSACRHGDDQQPGCRVAPLAVPRRRRIAEHADDRASDVHAVRSADLQRPIVSGCSVTHDTNDAHHTHHEDIAMMPPEGHDEPMANHMLGRFIGAISRRLAAISEEPRDPLYTVRSCGRDVVIDRDGVPAIAMTRSAAIGLAYQILRAVDGPDNDQGEHARILPFTPRPRPTKCPA